jgi:Asp-tRNA(Asn)/Glu-tRNA(Gln) amidotransferase C subunit
MSNITTNSLAKTVKLSKLGEDILGDQKLMSKVSSVLDLSDQNQELNTTQVNLFDGWRKNKITDLRTDTPPQNQTLYLQRRSNIIKAFPVSNNDLLLIDGIFEDN